MLLFSHKSVKTNLLNLCTTRNTIFAHESTHVIWLRNTFFLTSNLLSVSRRMKKMIINNSARVQWRKERKKKYREFFTIAGCKLFIMMSWIHFQSLPMSHTCSSAINNVHWNEIESIFYGRNKPESNIFTWISFQSWSFSSSSNNMFKLP